MKAAKIFALLLSAAMLFALSACGNDDKKEDKSETNGEFSDGGADPNTEEGYGGIYFPEMGI